MLNLRRVLNVLPTPLRLLFRLASTIPQQEDAGWKFVDRVLDKYTKPNINLFDTFCSQHNQSRAAIHWEGAVNASGSLSYEELGHWALKAASIFKEKGIKKGDRVGLLLPKCPELLISCVALHSLGAVTLPLFTAFGPDAIEFRVNDAGAKLIITDEINAPKLTAIPDLKASILTAAPEQSQAFGPKDFNPSKKLPAGHSFWDAVTHALPLASHEQEVVSPDDLLCLVYTSGTTGQPKGVQINVRALAAFETYMRLGLDVREEDVFWNVADPGWAYGLYYAVYGPLAISHATMFVQRPFVPEDIFATLARRKVSNLAAAPTAYRALRAAAAADKHKFHLRTASSAGEPLSPALVDWALDNFKCQIRDHYGQTELGMVVINHNSPLIPGSAQRPQTGSMGMAMRGMFAEVLGPQHQTLAAGEDGTLAIDANSPLFIFGGYWKNPEKTQACFTGPLCSGYYLTGDKVQRDRDFQFYYSGRADDIILRAGYRVGPAEVEASLVQHPSVSEAAVIGVPDAVRGQEIKAFVVVTPQVKAQLDQHAETQLISELRVHVKEHLSAHMYPRIIAIVDSVPKTPSGKIQRFLLRLREEEQ